MLIAMEPACRRSNTGRVGVSVTLFPASAAKKRVTRKRRETEDTKTEGIWLIITTTSTSPTTSPGVPPYNQPTATLIHAALTVLPIWVITYIFLPKVYRIYKLRNEKKEDK